METIFLTRKIAKPAIRDKLDLSLFFNLMLELGLSSGLTGLTEVDDGDGWLDMVDSGDARLDKAWNLIKS